MGKFMQVLVCFVLLFLPAYAEQADRSPLAGPVVELRFGAGFTGYELSGFAPEGAMATSFADTSQMSGLKVGWRGQVGRVTFGPMLGVYSGGTNLTFSGEYLPEAVSGQFRYRQDLSATIGLQVGVALGRGWFVYGEAGLVGERAKLDVGVMQGAFSAAYKGTGYMLGRNTELGLAKSLGESVYVTFGYHAREFTLEDWTDGVGGAIDIKTEGLQIGIGWQF